MSNEVGPEELRTVPLFRGLGDENLELLRARLQRIPFAEGKDVLKEGEANDRLLCVLSGRLRIWRHGSPNDVVLVELGPGGVLGELTFIDPGEATATATALEAGAAAVLSASDFAAIEKEHPTAALALYRLLALALKQKLTDATTLLLAHTGIQEAFSEVEELRVSLGQLI